MGGTSKIEWTEATWNPVVGCSIVSPGCTNCYAMRDAWRKHHIRSMTHYHGLTQKVNGKPVWTGRLSLAPERTLCEPLRRRKPTMWFVNSMGDLFHEECQDEWIDRVFAVMALCPQHTFQVLTKRSARMRAYFERIMVHGFERLWDTRPEEPTEFAILGQMLAIAQQEAGRTNKSVTSSYPTLPLQNVWLGVSAERQKEADERIPDLLATPAAVRFVSAEPLLGPIGFRAIGGLSRIGILSNRGFVDALTGETEHVETRGKPHAAPSLPGIDWVIVGGESGPGARPMHPDWARTIRDQCQAAGVAFFFKQWGAFAVAYEIDGRDPEIRIGHLLRDPDLFRVDGHRANVAFMRRVGKKSAGRLLDGREWNEFPSLTRNRTPAEQPALL